MILYYATDWYWLPGNGSNDWGWGSGADPRRHFLRQRDGAVSTGICRFCFSLVKLIFPLKAALDNHLNITSGQNTGSGISSQGLWPSPGVIRQGVENC